MVFKDKVRFVAVSVFITDITVLIIVLVILWTMTNGHNDIDHCEIICIRQTHCGCRTDTLQTYLKREFHDKFQTVETKRRDLQRKHFLEHNTRFENMQKLGYRWSMNPIARLSGSKQNVRKGDNTKHMIPLRKWEKKRRSYCYLRNGMSYRNGRLVVPLTGFYHVYSFLDLFQEYCDGNGKMLLTDMKKDAAIQHAIFKFNIITGKEEELISTYKPYQHSMNGHFNFYETYLSADVRLESGDEVYLKISNITFVQNPSKNFFGVHML